MARKLQLRQRPLIRIQNYLELYSPPRRRLKLQAELRFRCSVTFEMKYKLPAQLKDTYQQGVTAEEKNVAMYDKLLVQVRDYPDLTQVFTHLQFASREHHLPAFRAAVELQMPISFTFPALTRSAMPPMDSSMLMRGSMRCR